MNTLDFGEVMEKEFWFEDYDLNCPFCNGSGERTVYLRGAVRSYEEFDGYLEEEEEQCDKCSGEGQFEIMWNTAFEVYLRDGDCEDSRRLAWEHGFCLIEHGNSNYLLMGCCGLDNTWCIHYIRWKLQGYLDPDDVSDCLGSGGYVFLQPKLRLQMCRYLRDRMLSPAAYAERYAHDQKKLLCIQKGKRS